MHDPIVWHPAYEVDIGPHVFPTRKYRLVRDRLLAEGAISSADLVEATPASDEQVALVHTAAYMRKIQTGALSLEDQLVLEVPFSAALREAAWICAGGTTLAARLALERGVAVHLGGGFHHAFPDHVLYLAGADPYRFDQLGGLGLSLEGLRQRDELVFRQAASAGVAVAVCLAGGYALRTEDTVEIHCNTVRTARQAPARAPQADRHPHRASSGQ